jgi:hypothetical protein
MRLRPFVGRCGAKLHREIARLLAVQDAIDISGRATKVEVSFPRNGWN